jgi:hypothetical protein
MVGTEAETIDEQVRTWAVGGGRCGLIVAVGRYEPRSGRGEIEWEPVRVAGNQIHGPTGGE